MTGCSKIRGLIIFDGIQGNDIPSIERPRAFLEVLKKFLPLKKNPVLSDLTYRNSQKTYASWMKWQSLEDARE
jgi:hypothetical protein